MMQWDVILLNVEPLYTLACEFGRGGGSKFGKQKWPRWLSKAKDAVGVNVYRKQEILVLLYRMGLWAKYFRIYGGINISRM
jgi:hypothetical protein